MVVAQVVDVQSRFGTNRFGDQLILSGAGYRVVVAVDASEALRVLEDGSIGVTEAITFSFSGQFQGAYREIPSRFGESVDLRSISVSEGGMRYTPGGTVEIGSPGPANTFAVAGCT